MPIIHQQNFKEIKNLYIPYLLQGIFINPLVSARHHSSMHTFIIYIPYHISLLLLIYLSTSQNIKQYEGR